MSKKKSGLPQVGEIVLCRVKKLTSFAAWCDLEEYENVEGMIHISEVAGRWVRNIHEFVKQDKKYVAKVVRVERDKNFVNLSLKRVSRFDEKEKMNIIGRSRRAEKIFEQVAKEMGKSVEDAYKEVGFLLQEKFGEMFTAFDEIGEDRSVLDKFDISQKWKDALANMVGKMTKEKETVLKVEVDAKSYSPDGLEKIKSVFSELEKNGALVRYISAPKYKVELKTTDPKNGEKKLKDLLESVVKKAGESDVEMSYNFVK